MNTNKTVDLSKKNPSKKKTWIKPEVEIIDSCKINSGVTGPGNEQIEGVK